MAKKASPKRKPTVCLLFSHPLMLEEFRRLLPASEFNLQAQRLEPALAFSVEKTPLPRADVYVLDALTPHQATEVLVASIRELYPQTPQVIVAERVTEAMAFPLLRHRVKGLLTYEAAKLQLSRALHSVVAGGYWVPRDLVSTFIDSMLSRRTIRGPAELTRREREVLELLKENLSNKEIANKLNISERTAKFHVSTLLGKFSVQRRTDLILLCFNPPPSLP